MSHEHIGKSDEKVDSVLVNVDSQQNTLLTRPPFVANGSWAPCPTEKDKRVKQYLEFNVKTTTPLPQPSQLPQPPQQIIEKSNRSSTVKSNESHKHIHPCRCDIRHSILEYIQQLETQRRLQQETLKNRLSHLQQYLVSQRKLSQNSTLGHNITHQQPVFFNERDGLGKIRGNKARNIFVSGKTPSTTRHLEAKVTPTSHDNSSSLQLEPNGRIAVIYKRFGGSKSPAIPFSILKHPKTKQMQLNNYKSENPKVLQTLKKYQLSQSTFGVTANPRKKKSKSSVKSRTEKLELSWKKDPIIPVNETRTTRLRKLAPYTYCGKPPKYCPVIPFIPTKKISIIEPKIIHHTTLSLLRIKAAKTRSEALELEKQKQVEDTRPLFEIGYPSIRYRNTNSKVFPS